MSKKLNTKTIVDKCIKDKNGKVVLGQSPNVPIAGWFLFFVAAYIVPAGVIQSGLSSVSTALLIVWAYLEIAQGVNYFRRALGITVLSLIFLNYFR